MESNEVPEVPLRVYARATGHRYPRWWVKFPVRDYWEFEDALGDSGANPAEDSELTVVPHPMNDEAAIALIAAAQPKEPQ
jgi:hypothetical protein